MPNPLTERGKQQIYLTLITAVGMLRFVNLGFLDMQAWDEALYAIRADGILRFGGWFDQTPFAIDGLYSSLHPPLYVWLTAVSFLVFGVNEFAARFFSALLCGLTLFVIYKIGKKIANPEVGFFAALLFGLNPFVTFYSRQGQFDAALVFFLSVAIFYLIHSEANRVNYFFTGLAMGAALMTKLFVGLGIPLTYGLSILVSGQRNNRKLWQNFAILVATGAVVALPWHLYMTFNHGAGDPFFFFRASALFERALYGAEGNVKPLGVFYFVNQLFVLFPIGVFWFVFGLARTVKEQNQEWLLLGTWFLLFFLVFTLIHTKLAVYLLPLLVPASLIAARELWKMINGELSNRTVAILMAGSFISSLWASSQDWRNATKLVLEDSLKLHLPSAIHLSQLMVPFILGILVIAANFTAYKLQFMNFLHRPLVFLLFLFSLAWSGYQILILDPIQYNDGGKELAQFIHKSGFDRIVVAGYERNPQLTFYLQGADIGWRENIALRRIIPPKESTQFRSWLQQEIFNEPSESLLIVEKDKFIRYKIIDPLEIIPPDYERVFESRRYSAYKRAKPVQLANKT